MVCESGKSIGPISVKMKASIDPKDPLQIEVSSQVLAYIRTGMRSVKEDTAEKHVKIDGVRWRAERNSWLAHRQIDEGQSKRTVTKAFRPKDLMDSSKSEALDIAQRWVRGEEVETN